MSFVFGYCAEDHCLRETVAWSALKGWCCDKVLKKGDIEKMAKRRVLCYFSSESKTDYIVKSDQNDVESYCTFYIFKLPAGLYCDFPLNLSL
jgi:hypothetical protein